jgi:hypothetical protein
MSSNKNPAQFVFLSHKISMFRLVLLSALLVAASLVQGEVPAAVKSSVPPPTRLALDEYGAAKSAKESKKSAKVFKELKSAKEGKETKSIKDVDVKEAKSKKESFENTAKDAKSVKEAK